MKKLLLILTVAIFATACSSKDDEPNSPEKTLNDLDLSKVESLYGKWLLEEEGSMPQDMILTINPDGTTSRAVSAYNIPGVYTYDHGTLTVTEKQYSETTWNYVFTHHNEYRLKVVVTMKGVEGLPSTYLAHPYGK